MYFFFLYYSLWVLYWLFAFGFTQQWNLAPESGQEICLQFILHIFCQSKKNSSCLSGEYKQYAPVWILITCLSEKGYRNFPLGRMPWRVFFSFHVENFLQMFLLRYCSCNSLWKFTWHKCTTETHFHPRNTWQILFSWNECRIFSYCEGGCEAAWSIGILFGRLGFQFTMGFS